MGNILCSKMWKDLQTYLSGLNVMCFHFWQELKQDVLEMVSHRHEQILGGVMG